LKVSQADGTPSALMETLILVEPVVAELGTVNDPETVVF
jgi:hypothetical protein